MRTILLASAVSCLLAPAVAKSQSDERQRIDTTFAFEKNGAVDLGLVSGDIIVAGWNRPEVKLFASIEIGYFDYALSPSRVRVTARSRRNRMGDQRIEISVPIGTEVRASTVSGNIAVRGTAGRVQVGTVSGDLDVRDAMDDIEIRTTSGDLRAEKLRGRIRANSTSGDFALDDVSGDLRFHTVSGTLRARGALDGLEFESVSGDFVFRGDFKNEGTYTARTHSGDIRLTLPANLAANVDLSTFSGDLRTEFPLTLQPGESAGRRGRQMRTTINGGGARITLTTFSGDITLEKGAARPTKEN